MKHVVVAVYETAPAAEAAVYDPQVARVPSAVIRQFVTDPAREGSVLPFRDRSMVCGNRIVAVTVDDSQAQAVTELLGMQAPAHMTEAPLQVT
jgi:hypothetical protein